MKNSTINNYIKSLLIVILSIISHNVNAQNRTISGRIKDSQNGEPIVGATIFSTITKNGTVTNRNGYFSLIIKESNQDSIIIRYIGYKTQVIASLQFTSSICDIPLEPTSITTDEVVVQGVHNVMNIQNTQVGAHSISPKEIEYLPSLGGEKDVIKALQMLPGVNGGEEGSSTLVVRGGTPDQNLFLIDQVPVYNASHALGLFSVFTPEAISHVDFYKAGFPANYGGRLSSVVDISMKEGNRNHITGNISIGTISSKGLIEGPINKGKGAFIITARRTYLDLILAPFLTETFNESWNGIEDKSTSKVKSYFYDVTGKLTYQLSPKTKAFFSIYQGQDYFGLRDKGNTSKKDDFYCESDYKTDIQWSNLTSSLRFNHIHNSRLYSDLTLYTSNYNYDTELSIKEFSTNNKEGVIQDYSITNNYLSKVTDYGMKYESHLNLTPSQRVRWGASAIYHLFTPGKKSQTTTEYGSQNQMRTGAEETSTKEGGLFAHWENSFNAKWKTNLGIRYSYYRTQRSTFQQIEPRFSLRFLATDKISIKASYAMMQQPIHLLAQSNFVMGTSIWVPATSKVPPGQSHQLSIGTIIGLTSDVTFSVEGWAKKLYNQVEFRYGTYDSSENWENEVTTGEGRAFGIDFLLRKQKGKTTGWISYTLSKNERKYSELNNGRWYPYRYDRTHDLKAVVQHTFTKRFSLGANYLFSSGYPITIPSSYYSTISSNDTQTKALYISSINNDRMQCYHRLDLSFSFRKQKRRGTRTWTYGIYNIYGRKNAFNYITDINQDEYYSTNIKITKLSIFSIIPSITYSFNFK